jgi:hypothetical protein
VIDLENVDFKQITEKKFVIYGAQVVAYGAYRALKNLYHVVPECFVVSSRNNNPDKIDGISVKTLFDIERDVMVIICVTELLQDEIIANLKENGFTNYIRLTQKLEHQLMELYFSKEGRFCIAGNVGKPETDFKLYEVKNHRDKTLAFHPELREFEKAIQAGAALTDMRIADIADNTGDNISEKNKQYCEMTATYWVWKNTRSKWKGIEHYRRHLLVEPEMLSDDLDAVMPLPYICYPNTLRQFRRFVSEDVLQALLKALKELHPDKYEEYCEKLYGEYQYTYNLVIAREDVFDAYCSWFFEITEYMETMSGSVREIKETRALSYVAEVLTNLYFMYNGKNLNIRHVAKAIYV